MTPGYHVMKAAQYHTDPCVSPSLSASVAKIILQGSPRKAAHSHPRLNPNFRKVEESKFDIGTVAHAMLLEGVDVMVVCDFNDWKKNEAKAQRDAARAAGKVPLLTKHRNDVVAMVAAAEAFIQHSEIADYWKDAESELVGIVQEDGVWLRSRFDRIAKNRRFIMDYKSTTDVAPEVFSRQIVRMGYHVQEAFYRRVARVLGASAPRFAFVAQSCEAPYECSLHGCDPALQEIADADVQRAIDLWRQCLVAKLWPSYGGRIHWAIPTSWQMKDHEERLMEAAS